MIGVPKVAAADILRNPVKEKLARGVASMTVRLSRSIEIAQGSETAAAGRALQHRHIRAPAIPLVPGGGDHEGDQ
jgi:hypothetical protein